MIAKRLKELRSESGRKQHEVAKYLGITRPAYTAYESGSRQPDLETVKKLAEYFNTTTDYLLGKSDNPAAVAPDSQVVKESPAGFMADAGKLSLEGLIRIIKETVREVLDEREKNRE